MTLIDLSSYTGLIDAVGQFLARDDLADQIPAFIHLTEDKIRRQVRRRTIVAQVPFMSDTFPVPADCAELRGGRPVVTPSRSLPFTVVSPAYLDELRALYPTPGVPRFLSVVDTNIRMVPAPQSGTLAELRYYQKLIPLSSSVPTNTVLQEASDIYLYGALSEAAPYLKDDERVALWEGRFAAAVADLNNVRQREETAAALSRPRLPTCFG